MDITWVIKLGVIPFTIQNVPIKYYDVFIKLMQKLHLQYKMFLLNPIRKSSFHFTFTTFTIQNVPIKYFSSLPSETNNIHLQYKMFLLNNMSKYDIIYNVAIYNTKCSY